MTLIRCAWAKDEPLELAYHDHEWGVPQHDDQRLFEFLILEGAQAGLSWSTILKKREGYREAFDGFDVERVARYDDDKIVTLLTNPGIVRNRLKVQAAVLNAQAVLEIRREWSSLDVYLWQFVKGQPIINAWPTLADLPAETAESRAMSRDLKQRGCKFVGPTICYALMQACGLVNDHTVDCFRYAALGGRVAH
ncbi:MAG: DNA-3-methyladenine glycosylase I [Kaiparowitsia implicata GSE-PSE-MK54-09C]|jgi:DNA-3-methyladenine glycosylase I|nr:DNA-3-methyladenine glycosylase I [Kaiparowitsia implicata GSE-PSE-MK54-09C]